MAVSTPLYYSKVQVTGSSLINPANFVGAGGTNVVYSGQQIIVSSAPTGGNVTIPSGQYLPGKVVSSNYSILPTDNRIFCNNTTPITLTFPSAIIVSGLLLDIKLINTGSVYFTGTFGQKFDGSDLYVAAGQYNAYGLQAFAPNWYLW